MNAEAGVLTGLSSVAEGKARLTASAFTFPWPLN